MATLSVAPAPTPRDTSTFGSRLLSTLAGEAKVALIVYPLFGLAGVLTAIVAEAVHPGLIRLRAAAPVIKPPPETALVPVPVDPIQAPSEVPLVKAPPAKREPAVGQTWVKAIPVPTSPPPQSPDNEVRLPVAVADPNAPLPPRKALTPAMGRIGGILSVNDRPRFRDYVRERGVRSYDYGGRVAVGEVVPRVVVTHRIATKVYNVPPGTRFTVLNNTLVLLNQSNRIVDVLSN